MRVRSPHLRHKRRNPNALATGFTGALGAMAALAAVVVVSCAVDKHMDRSSNGQHGSWGANGPQVV